jgi:hypothetical protein
MRTGCRKKAERCAVACGRAGLVSIRHYIARETESSSSSTWARVLLLLAQSAQHCSSVLHCNKHDATLQQQQT